MDENFQANHNFCKSGHKSNINSYLATLVNNKISKEISSSSKSEDSSELNQNSVDDIGQNFVIAKCKGLLGIQFCNNVNNLELSILDDVILNINGTYEFANIEEIGEIVNLRKYKIDIQLDKLPIVERLVTPKDSDKNNINKKKSIDAKEIFIDYVKRFSLEMKLVDVHHQFDGKKIFFFYTADGRVDFRELAKSLAGYFKTRIELRQIGVRDEAKIIGGIATCGREFCCASFMCSFKKITAEDAYKNNISSNISNYTGPCNKLKCCLTYDI